MLTHLALGLVIGIILALTGAGGGILAIPLLIFGAHQSVAEAGPIGLLAVGMAAALGAGIGLRAGIVRYRAALLVAAAGMALSPAGLWLAHRIDNRALMACFAAVLLLVAFRTFRQATNPCDNHPGVTQDHPPCIRDAASGRLVWTASCRLVLALSGALAGLLSGLLGVGGGFVVVPALRRYSDLTMQSVVATSLAVIALVSATSVAASAIAGNLNWPAALPFAAGALAGMIGGRAIVTRLAESHLQKGFALVALLVAIGMLVKAVQ